MLRLQTLSMLGARSQMSASGSVPLMMSSLQVRCFTGKTEDGHKWRTPKLRMRKVKRISPPPGLNLQIPADLDPETFCRQIGGDCDDIADKFETIDQMFTLDVVSVDCCHFPV